MKLCLRHREVLFLRNKVKLSVPHTPAGTSQRKRLHDAKHHFTCRQVHLVQNPKELKQFLGVLWCR